MKTKILIFLIVLIYAGTLFYYLSPEFTENRHDFNDSVLHLAFSKAALKALEQGENVLDFWEPSTGFGCAAFHHYQHFSHVAIVYIYQFFGGRFSLEVVYHFMLVLILALFPLSVFLAMRRLGFNILATLFATFISALYASAETWGINYNSYLYWGHGITTQAWAMLFVPLAFAYSYRYILFRTDRVKAILCLSLTFLNHLVYGYFLAILLLVTTLVRFEPALILKRFRRVGLILFFTFLTCAYFFIPALIHGDFANISVWEPQIKWNSLGLPKVLTLWANGDLFDAGRIPVITLLALIGLIVGFKSQVLLYKWASLLFGVSLLFYAGKETWGILFHLLPMHKGIHMQRFLGIVQICSIFLAGIGFAYLFNKIYQDRSRFRFVLGLSLGILLLLPGILERFSFFDWNEKRIQINAFHFRETNPDYKDLLTLFKDLQAGPPGRLFVGHKNGWGKDIKIGDAALYLIIEALGLEQVSFLFHSMSLAGDTQYLIAHHNPLHYYLYNIRYVIAILKKHLPPFCSTTKEYGRYYLCKINTEGYFGLYQSDIALYDRPQNLFGVTKNWLNSGLLNYRQVPALFFQKQEQPGYHYQIHPTENITPYPPIKRPFQTLGHVFEEKVSLNHYQVRAQVIKSAVLMLRVSFHPNWQAYVNGHKTAPLQLLPGFMGIPLSPGDYEIAFHYEAGSVKGLLLGFGIIALLLLYLAGKLRRVLLPIRQSFRKHFDPGRWLTRCGQRAYEGYHRFMLLLYQRRWEIPLVLIPLLMVIVPLLPPKILDAHDCLEYLPRLVEFDLNIRNGNLIPQWAPDFIRGYGDPMFLFSPLLNYYIAEGFHLLGASKIVAINLTWILIIILAYCGMYLLARRYCRREVAYLAAAAYILSNYFLFEIYVRFALAEFSAFGIFPFLLLLVDKLFHGPGRLTPIWLSGAIFLLMLSHNIMALAFLPLVFLFILWKYFETLKRAEFGQAILGCLLGLGLSAYFWLPSILLTDLVYIDRLLEGYLNFSNHFVYFQQFLYSRWGHGISIAGSQDKLSFEIGVVHLFTLVLVFIALIKRLSPNRSILMFLLISVGYALFFSATFSKWLYTAIRPLQYIEFPWRFLAVLSVGSALLFMIYEDLLGEMGARFRLAIIYGILILLSVTAVVKIIPKGYKEIDERDYTPRQIAVRGIAATTKNEYQSRWTRKFPKKYQEHRLELAEGVGEITKIQIRPTRLKYRAQLKTGSLFKVNISYFPGWTVRVNSKPVAIDRYDEYGGFYFRTPAGTHFIDLQFKAPPLLVNGKILSWLSGLALIIFGFCRFRS